jgi:hypothetical protein
VAGRFVKFPLTHHLRMYEDQASKPLEARLTSSLERCEGCNVESHFLVDVFVRHVHLASKMVLQSNHPLVVSRAWEEKVVSSQVQVTPTGHHSHWSLLMIDDEDSGLQELCYESSEMFDNCFSVPQQELG